MAKNYRIAVIAGDGIGREVMPQGIAAMEAAARAYGFGFAWNDFDWSCERYTKTGRMMPEDGLERLRLYDAVYLGAVGHPDVPGPRLAVGPFDPVAAWLSPICQSPSGAASRRCGVAIARPRAG